MGFTGTWEEFGSSVFRVQKMDRQREEGVVPEVAQFALIIAKCQTAEVAAGYDESVEPSFGRFGRFGLHMEAVKAKGLPKNRYFLPFFKD